MFCPDYAGLLQVSSIATENGSNCYKATITWNPWNEVSMVMDEKMTMQVWDKTKSKLKTKNKQDINTNITINSHKIRGLSTCFY